MPNLDFWIQEPFVFIVGENADTLIRYRIPTLAPVESDEPLPPPPHWLNGPMWLLPGLPDGYSEIFEASYQRVIRYQTTARPGSWKPPSHDPCMTAVMLHAHDVVEDTDADGDGDGRGNGGIYFIDTRPDESGEVLQPRILPKSPPPPDPHEVSAFSVMVMPSWEDESNPEYESDPRARTQLSLYPHSRIHLLGLGLGQGLEDEGTTNPDHLLISIKNEALLDPHTQTISLQYRAYSFSPEGYLEQWPIARTVFTDIPWDGGKGAASRRIKTTSAPCSITGTFLASEKAMAPGAGSGYTAKVWLMKFA